MLDVATDAAAATDAADGTAADLAGPTLAEAVRLIPVRCRTPSTARGLLLFGRDVGLLVVAGAVLVRSDNPLALLAGWALGGLVIAALFVIGHDAAHGALFRSRRLCHVVGQLAMLPSLHPFETWAYGHNRVHHTFTTCRDFDFVWHPTTRAEYERLSLAWKLVHRIEWSVVGAGLYYARVIWWGKIMRGTAPGRLTATFRRERRGIACYFVLLSAALVAAGWSTYGSVTGAVWMWIKVFAVPWMAWNAFIGWTVYLHHIHPEIQWFSRGQWRKFRAQVDGSTTIRLPRWAEFFAHNIFFHVAHHVDPRIPFYHLPEATRVLRKRYGGRVREVRYRYRDYVAVTRRCKLYDFETSSWLRYDGTSRPVPPEVRAPGAA
jgi:acyl-lipid omega-6 desaturase (Delta-12 desaturase)